MMMHPRKRILLTIPAVIAVIVMLGLVIAVVIFWRCSFGDRIATTTGNVTLVMLT
jgi:hypothetical protein